MFVVLRFVRYLDVLAPKVSLNIGGQETIKTLAGGSVSLLYMGLLLVACVLSSLAYLDTTSPSINRQTVVHKSSPKIDLVRFGQLPILTFYNDGGGVNLPIESVPRYLTLDAFRNDYSTSKNGSELVNTADNLYFTVVPCRDLLLNGSFHKVYPKAELSATYRLEVESHGFCLYHDDPSQFFVKGSYEEGHTSSITYVMYPCSLDDASQCASEAELDKLLIQVISPSININYSSYHSPVTSTYKHLMDVKIDPGLSKFVSQRLSLETIYDNQGFLTTERKVAEFVLPSVKDPVPSLSLRKDPSTTCDAAMIYETGTCRSYFQFAIFSSPIGASSARSYKGIIETCGEIGGNKQILDFLFLIIHTGAVHWIIKRLYIKQVYGIDGRKQEGISKWIEPKKRSEVSSSAFALIEDTLDIVNIVKEISKLKLLSHLLLRKRHRLLAPMCCLEIHMNRKKSLKGEALLGSEDLQNLQEQASPKQPLSKNIIRPSSPKKIMNVVKKQQKQLSGTPASITDLLGQRRNTHLQVNLKDFESALDNIRNMNIAAQKEELPKAAEEQDWGDLGEMSEKEMDLIIQALLKHSIWFNFFQKDQTLDESKMVRDDEQQRPSDKPADPGLVFPEQRVRVASLTSKKANISLASISEEIDDSALEKLSASADDISNTKTPVPLIESWTGKK